MSLSPYDELIVKMCEIETYIHLLIGTVLTESWQSLIKQKYLFLASVNRILMNRFSNFLFLTLTLACNRSLQ